MKKKEKLFLSLLIPFRIILSICILSISLVGLLSYNNEDAIKLYSGYGQEIPASVVSDQIENTVIDKEDFSSELFPCVVFKNVDGDTIYVTGDIFEEETKIRFIGINTPESVSPNAEKNCDEGRAASDYTAINLVPGMQIYLEFDENRTDQYGRTLAYVWLSNSVDTSSCLTG